MQRPYIDLVGGSGQVEIEFHQATNSQTPVLSQEVPETKVCAVLRVSPRCPSLAPAGDTVSGETDCRSNTGWVLLSPIHGRRPHSASIYLQCHNTRQHKEQNPTVFLQIQLASLTTDSH